MSALRFGVIGCGSMGGLHCRNAQFAPDMKTVAYCDVAADRAKAFLDRFGGEYATTDPARLFDDDSLDGLLIQTGEVHHPELIVGGARAGKHLFCEKPLARTLAEARSAVEAVESAGIVLVFGVCQRLGPMTRRAKRILPNPVYSFCQCSDTVTGQAVHNLDLAVNLFHDAPVRTVYAQGRQVWGLDPHLSADSFVATLTFADESIHCYIQHGASRNGTLQKFSFQLFGKDRCVYLPDRFRKCIVHDGNGNVTQQMQFMEGSSGGNPEHDARGPYGYMGHYDELVHLCECIRTGGAPEMSVQDGLRVLAVEKAILESVETGRPVDFASFLSRHGIERWGSSKAR